MTATVWLTFRLLIREEHVLYIGWEPGYPDRPCINFRSDRDCAVLGLCNSVKHPNFDTSVCERQVAGEMLNSFSHHFRAASRIFDKAHF